MYGKNLYFREDLIVCAHRLQQKEIVKTHNTNKNKQKNPNNQTKPKQQQNIGYVLSLYKIISST